MKKIIYLLFISVLFYNCSDNCNEGKNTNPPSFFIKLINNTTNENIFTNDFLPEHITITYENEDEDETNFNYVENLQAIQIFPDASLTSPQIFVITLNNPDTLEIRTISISYSLTTTNGECYTTYNVNNVQCTSHSLIFINGFYEIKI